MFPFETCTSMSASWNVLPILDLNKLVLLGDLRVALNEGLLLLDTALDTIMDLLSPLFRTAGLSGDGLNICALLPLL